MEEYCKIETLLDRDLKTFGVIEGKWRLPEFEYLVGNQWVWTEKVDGTNIRVMWDGQQVRFGGRTDTSQIPVFLSQKLQECFPVEKFATLYPAQPLCLYGEGYGARIQKGGGNYNSKGVDFVLFDVLVDKWWLQRKDIEDVAEKLSISVVPIVGTGTLIEVVSKVKQGITSAWGNFKAEGLVVKPLVELQTRTGQRVVGKLKQRDFK